MALTVTRKRAEIDLILDQDTAERIGELGERLAAAERDHHTEGANQSARTIAARIERLREDAADAIIHITLQALPLSQWRQILEANTRIDGKRPVQRVEDICADAVRAMTVATEPETSPDDIADAMRELSDGQITPIWTAIRDLNTKVADPKAVLRSASAIARA